MTVYTRGAASRVHLKVMKISPVLLYYILEPPHSRLKKVIFNEQIISLPNLSTEIGHLLQLNTFILMVTKSSTNLTYNSSVSIKGMYMVRVCDVQTFLLYRKMEKNIL